MDWEELAEGIILLGLLFSLALLIRARKETELLAEKLQGLKSQWRTTIAEKNIFLATASHDFQQPHQALGLFLASIHTEKLDEETRAIINKAKDAHTATTKLLNQLLDISKLDAAEKPELKSIALHDIVHNIGMKFMPIAASYGVELRIRQRDAYALTDSVMLERMLTNILLNAFRHAKKANVLLSIRQKNINNQKYWQIEVYDTGIGIPKDKQSVIFQEFTKLSKPELSPTGLGLGLAIVKRLSYILEHPVGLRSRLGKGTCFYIQIKANNEHQNIIAMPPIDSVIRQRMKVVVINGNTMLRDSLETLLASWGCRAKAFHSSSSALKYIHKNTWLPDALIVDGTLKCTQFNLEDIQDIHKLSGQSMPMILITNKSDNMYNKEAEKIGFTLISNPVEASILRNTLGNQ